MKKSVVARLFAMSLAAVMTMGLLTACGGSDCQRRYKFSLSKYLFSVRIKIRDFVNLVCT